jgi:hypothetical protein
MVVSSTTKPQKVKKWASPGSGRFRSLRWPKTSTSSARRRAQAPSNRSGAGWPEVISLVIRSARWPARATAKKVSTAPMASFIARPPGLSLLLPPEVYRSVTYGGR